MGIQEKDATADVERWLFFFPIDPGVFSML